MTVTVVRLIKNIGGDIYSDYKIIINTLPDLVLVKYEATISKPVKSFCQRRTKNY